jgi:hypothetical protein
MSAVADTATQTTNQETPPVFRIAVSMSGAISAGAYTAGVFDFLIQALAELDAARRDTSHVDHHKVPAAVPRIVALTGASAGGITAALGAIALGYGIMFDADAATSSRRKPVRMAPTVGPDKVEGVLPSLYDAWVVKPRMVADSGPSLLTTEDLEDKPAGSGKLVSLLNTRILDEIRDASLRPPAQVPPLAQFAPYPFCFETLHVYLTITNLSGIQYDIKGDRDSTPYHMVTHADRLHFKVAGLGNGQNTSGGWADCDNGDKIDVADLKRTAGPSRGWQRLGDGALATAAFPAGLSARALQGNLAGYQDRWFPAPAFDGAKIHPVFPTSYSIDPFLYANIDGGVINNDPFDFARFSLLADWKADLAHNPRDPTKADRAVIMISPFPEGKTIPAYAPPNTTLFKIVALLVPTLLAQVRFKVDELAAAADSTIASRWLIAPRRSQDPNERPSSTNIACGALGGFGGFLDQGFREHDYILGRRNCQRFLQTWTESRFRDANGMPQPIVPLVGSAAVEVAEPHWPRMSRSDFALLMTHAEQRGYTVITASLRQFSRSRLMTWILSLPLKAMWKWLAVPKLRAFIDQELLMRKQLEPDR